MACLSKLDRHLKDLEEKLKYIIIIMRKIRRHRVLRDKKPRKAWVREIYKNRSAYGELFQELHADQELLLFLFYVLKIDELSNFRTHETSASFEISYRDAINIKKFWYSKYCDKADKGDSNTIRTIRKRSHYAISTISYYRIAIIALIAKWEPSLKLWMRFILFTCIIWKKWKFITLQLKLC